MINVAIIAPSRAVRVGMRVLLAADPSINVIGDGALLDQLQHAPLASADVVVVQGVSAHAGWLPPTTLRGLLFVIDDAAADAALAPLPPGASLAWGVLPGDAAAEELSAAVNALYNGLIIIHPNLAPQVLQRPATQPGAAREPLIEPLTSRELEVLQLIGQGLANKMIADQLHISEHTVKFHVSAIYAKLGVASRTEAVRAGARRGLIVL